MFNRVCHIDENLSDEILKLASETPEAFGNPTEEDFMARDDLVLKTKIDDIAEDPFRDPFLQSELNHFFWWIRRPCVQSLLYQ